MIIHVNLHSFFHPGAQRSVFVGGETETESLPAQHALFPSSNTTTRTFSVRFNGIIHITIVIISVVVVAFVFALPQPY